MTVTLTDVIEAAGAPGICANDNFEILDVAHAPELLDATTGTTTFIAATVQLLETGQNQDACKNADLVLSLVAS